MTSSQELSQEVFDFRFPATFGEDNFFVSEANREAVSAVSQVPWGHGAVYILCGPEGSGKTHMATIFSKMVGAKSIRGDDLENGREALLEANDYFVLEDLDKNLETSLEESLFHFYNALKAKYDSGQKCGLLITAQRPVDQWGIHLKDLHSRLRSCFMVPIHRPDQELLMAVLMKNLSDQQLTISPQVAQYIATHAERSFSYVHKLTRAIDRESLSARRKITIPLIKSVMGKLSP